MQLFREILLRRILVHGYTPQLISPHLTIVKVRESLTNGTREGTCPLIFNRKVIKTIKTERKLKQK